MKQIDCTEAKRAEPDEAAPQASSTIALGDGWSAALSPLPGGALLRVGGGPERDCMEIVISLGREGPVLRARAAALEIETQRDIVARCESFRIEARQDIELISGGTLQTQGRRIAIEATHGSAKVQANDNVQLLGENVLLNCEAPKPVIPAWALPPTLPQPSLPAASTSGDQPLLKEVAERKESV